MEKAQTNADDSLMAALRRHLPVWVVLAGVAVAMRFSAMPAIWISRVDRLLMVLMVMSVSFALSKFAVASIRTNADRLGLGTTTLMENLTGAVIYGMGFLLVLANLGLSITPLLTALGVGSLAVALALQDTLSNLFSGIYIIMNRQIRLGDYIKLDSGAEGFVSDIGWRATVIRDRTDNLILIPNTKIAQAVVTNFNLPHREFSVPIQVGVSYASDLPAVERVALEVAREVQKSVHGAIPTFEPVLRYHTFADSSVNFVIILRVKEFEDQHTVTHEFIKRLHARFRREGIEIPFPQRVVRIENAGGKLPESR